MQTSFQTAIADFRYNHTIPNNKPHHDRYRPNHYQLWPPLYCPHPPTAKHMTPPPAKKRVDFACGDQVRISPINGEQVVIEDYLPRESLLYRQDAWKTKLIAANVTQLLIVTAASPSPSEALLQRALLAAEAAGINAVIVLNKADLPETAQWREKLKFYETLGYSVVETNALENADILRPILEGQTNILLGQSGMASPP